MKLLNFESQNLVVDWLLFNLKKSQKYRKCRSLFTSMLINFKEKHPCLSNLINVQNEISIFGLYLLAQFIKNYVHILNI